MTATGQVGVARDEGLSGSAFAVAPGVLVTNAHVTLGCRRHGLPIRVGNLPGPWRILMEDAGTDLALLGGPAAGEGVLPLSSAGQLRRGTPVMTLGYPAAPADGLTVGLRSSTGRLLRAALTIHEPEGGRSASFVMRDRYGQEVAATWDDGLRYFGPGQADRLRWLLEIDAVTSGGNSGGPVLDGAGNVVGVIYAGDRQRGLTAVVPLDDLREVLRRADIVPRFGARHLASDPDWRAVATTAAGAVHRILC